MPKRKATKDETEHARFVKTTEKRIGQLMQRIDQLKKCSNRKYYNFTTSDVTEMMVFLQGQINELEKAFRESLAGAKTTGHQTTFHFGAR